MVDIKTLLPDLRKLVGELAEDLLARSTSDAKIDAGLREAFHQIEHGGRTAQAFEVWRDDYLDQVAVAWVLACVFVRFMEDNQLIDECWLAGEGERRRLAEDTHELFFRKHPHDTDREYFQHIFKEVGKIPAAKDLFVEGKTPLWAVALSGDAAMKLLKFWREMDAETGHLKRLFQVESGDTRFLGDLYQELSEKAKKKYALLQTPVFVEEFILDRTLTPAIAEFGLEKVRMIDPTCGSGHFLLGGFARLFELWSQRESNEIKVAQKALDGVWGVDINTFAVAIARFRLIVAAVQACGIKRLKQAPGWSINLASGDSLLFGSRPDGFGGRKPLRDGILFETSDLFAIEEAQNVKAILEQGYHVVVGNPPYITVKDKAQNEAYRGLYSTCHRKYSLGVPFTERFWELSIRKGERIKSDREEVSNGPGYIGMITANSFMKREFGKKLIEEYFSKTDLTHVIDTSGAYIPGHGTPTVILFGRSRKPEGDTIRAIQGIKGEPATPEDPSRGFVWQSIFNQIDTANTQDDFTSTADLSRATFSSHPWSIGGGGASDLMESLDEHSSGTLNDVIELVGVFGMTNADEVFLADRQSFVRSKVESHCIRQLQLGDELRDWTGEIVNFSIYPYSSKPALIPIDEIPGVFKWLWKAKTALGNRATFEKGSYFSEGLPWWKWHQIALDRLRSPYCIAFPFISSHNHFVLDRGGRVFNRTAPIIKLPNDATEDDYLGILGLLNSSIMWFWITQVSQIKGDGERGQESEAWFRSYEINATPLKRLPVPETRPLAIAKKIDLLAQQYMSLLPDVAIAQKIPTAESMKNLQTFIVKVQQQMIALQEELDWHCYRLYGLLSDDLSYAGDDLPELALGQRAFELVMARQMEKGEMKTAWFERHGSTPITEIPPHWSASYRKLIERRIKLIETNKEIAFIERPEYKRRWNTEPWKALEQRALKNWLLDRLEAQKYRKGLKDHPELTTTAQMADVASADAEFLQVAALYRGRPDFDVAALVAELVEAEAVPLLPIMRYKLAGVRKREVWERTWDLQRQQDAGKDVGEIPVPPKYASTDFVKSDFWRLRGKLDVPKERWISYPHYSTDSDPSLVVGWAGWNHLEQATALVAYYDARKREGWDTKRLTPLLAGLAQLLPWIHQWHPEIDPEFGETAGKSYQTLLESDAHELGLTLEDIRLWSPPEKAKKTTKGRKKKAEAEDDE